MLGNRPEALSLVIVRIIITAAVILQQKVNWPLPPFGITLLKGMLLGWTTLAVGGFFLEMPRSRYGTGILLVLDGLFACGTLLLGYPLAGFPLMIAGGLLWRACGGRWIVSPAIILYALAWLFLWAMSVGQKLDWPVLIVRPTDVLIWLLLFATIGAACRAHIRRNAAFATLRGENWVDLTLDADRPFSCDFTRWIERLGSLYEGAHCWCAIALFPKAGSAHIFMTPGMERLRPDIATLGGAREDALLPGSLSILRDRHRGMDIQGDDFAAVSKVIALLDSPVIMGREFRLGGQRGILLIAHRLANDAILGTEIARIDNSFNDVIQRLSQTMEMRRTFLIEARDVARRDLHDGVLQSLAALRMRLLTLLQSGGFTNSESAGEIRNIADIVALEQARLRSMLDAGSDADQPINLVEALRIGVATAALQWEMDIEFSCDEQAVPMHRESVHNIELLLREIISNATQHSRSKSLKCSLAIRESDLILSLKDGDREDEDIDLGDAGPLSSESLQQRLILVNGRAYSEGLPGGTLLAIAIPMVYDEDGYG